MGRRARAADDGERVSRPTSTGLGLPLGTRSGAPISPVLGGTPKILACGDSITAGTGSTDLGAWRTPLDAYMAAAGMARQWVGPTASPIGFAHHGVSSRKIPGLTADVAATMAAHTPDIVVVVIGRNNMEDATDAANAPSEYVTLLSTMYAQDPTCRVIACHITPEVNTTYWARTQTFRAALPAVLAASSYYADGLLIECRGGKSLTPLSTADLGDQVHPNDGGYLKIADDIWPAMRRAYGLAPLF